MGLAATLQLARNPQLRRLMAAWFTFYAGDFAFYVLAVVSVFSAGGAAAVAAATVLNVLPGGLLGPLAAALAVSRRPQFHLAFGIGARAFVTAGLVVAILSDASVAVILVLVGVDSIVSIAVRPLHGALIVRLADTASEAAAANAASSSLVSASALIGPALAGVTLGFVDVSWAFALPTAAFVLGAVSAALIKVAPLPGAMGMPETGDAKARGGAARLQIRAVGAGFRAILASRTAAASTMLFVVSMTLLGVWYVGSAPIAVEHLVLGEDGVATIMTIYGAGGLLGAIATLSVVGRRGLSSVLAAAMLALTLALAAVGVIFAPIAALALAAGLGAAGAVAYAIAPTLVQRGVDSGAMVSASASLQSLYLVGLAAGATASPFLFDEFGVTATMAAVGGFGAVLTLLTWPMLRNADELSGDDQAKLAVIRATPLLAPLPALAKEQLARAAIHMRVAAGSDVITQGDRGDRFYMIVTGLADVSVDGRLVATLGPGGSFGEIALLQDAPRSASVTARRDLDLVVVDRAEFLGALSGNAGAVGRAGGIANARLSTPPVEDRLAEVDRDALGGQLVASLLAPQRPLAKIPRRAVRELADTARIVAAPDGALITREGDYGDTYYVIIDGSAEVLEGDTVVNRLGPGDGFGEIAILRDVPRTATVRAVGATTLVVVDRDAFQAARRELVADAYET